MNEDKAILDAERVERFLADAAVQAAFQRAEENIIARWKAAKTKDTREELHADLRAIDSIKSALHAVIGDGQKAKHEKEARERREYATARRGQV